MKLKDLRVRNFRSIEAEQHLHMPAGMTLVGPNNSGKTNFLKSVQTLFTGLKNSCGYSIENDLTFNVKKSRTSIVANFDGDPQEDQEIYQLLDELHQLLDIQRTGTEIALTLYFTETNTPVYRFFPNQRRPSENTKNAQYSRVNNALVTKLLDRFSLHYVPSAKSVDQIYNDLLVPFLRRKVSDAVKPQLDTIHANLQEASASLNYELQCADLDGFKASFSLPNGSIEELLAGFDFNISDPQKTPIHDKGMGIQTTAILAAFRWITAREVEEGKSVIWLLEEPESYLHPSLAANCNTILENLEAEATVVKTTHSMAFVPQDPAKVQGTLSNAKERTELQGFKTFSDAISSIRSSLGIRFGDFFNLAKYNVFVEGPSDRETFQWVLSKIPEGEFNLTTVRKARFEDFGGVTNLAGFLRANYQFIKDEYSSVTILDGDQAGEKVRKELQGFFGNNQVQFEANRNFVTVRGGFSIEGLFPDQWIKEMREDHYEWFSDFSVDASNNLQPFSVKDTSKKQCLKYLRAKADASEDLEWAQNFITVLSAVDMALNINGLNLGYAVNTAE